MTDDKMNEKSGLLAASGKAVASSYQSHDDLSAGGKAERQLHHSASCGGAASGSVQQMDDQEANGELANSLERRAMLRRSSSSGGRLQRMESAHKLVKGSSMTFARQAEPGKGSAEGDGGLTPRLCLAVVVVSLGSSLQFGYGTGIMNNSEAFIRGSFEAEGKPYTLHMWAATVSMFGWGGLVGAMAGTKILSRWLGRKAILQATTLLVFLSSALMAFGPEWYYLTAGRFFVGVVAGVATGVVPTYLSEISPISTRGGIGTAHQLGITLGILLSETLSTPSLHLLGSMSLWKWLFAPPSILALLQLALMPFIPESPAYLYVNEGKEAARSALKLLRGEGAQAEREVEVSLELIEEEVSMQDQEEASSEQPQYTVMHLLRDRTVRKQLVVGVVVQLMMQLSGIDAVFYYSTDVFKLAGVHDPQLATTLLGTINVLVTLWALKYMDVAGRRTLLLASWLGMCLSYILLTFSLVTLASPTLDPSWLGAYERLSVISMTGVIIFFAFGPGCIAWLIISEIFPLHARESAMSVGMSINWVANWAVAFSFPVLLHVAREYAFLLFIATTSTFFFFTLCFVPETKNRSVPEITRIFQSMTMPLIGAEGSPTLPK